MSSPRFELGWVACDMRGKIHREMMIMWLPAAVKACLDLKGPKERTSSMQPAQKKNREEMPAKVDEKRASL